MSLTVLSVGYPFAPVGPDRVGGAEQILTIIEEAIVSAGHESLVLAARGSRCRGRLFEVEPPRGGLDEQSRDQTRALYRRTIDEILSACEVDVVHLHGVDFLAYLPPPGPAVLATLHLPPSFYPESAFYTERPRTYFNCVSQTQRRACPSAAVPMAVVPNGIPLSLFSCRIDKRKSAILLGRICPEKGFHLAIESARLAECELVLAGEVFPYQEHRRYFADEIAPRLDDKCRYLGAVGRRQKSDLLGRARCLLVPSLVEETSSLVAMEALASGTPVIGRRVGALTEIIEDGTTGFLVSTVEEMAAAISRAPSLDARACRAAAERYFSADRMTNQYLALYEEMVAA